MLKNTLNYVHAKENQNNNRLQNQLWKKTTLPSNKEEEL